MTNNQKSRTDELINVGILDIADLEINRSGHLSPSQKRMLYLNLSIWLIPAGFDMVLLVLFIYFLIAFERNLTLGIIGISFIIIPAYMCIVNAKPYWKDIQDDMPNTVSGIIYKHVVMGDGLTTDRGIYGFGRKVGYCNIRIEDQTFSISQFMYDHIIHEKHYRVYFVSNSRKLINIEPLKNFHHI